MSHSADGVGIALCSLLAALLSSETYGRATYWPLWALPWLLILVLLLLALLGTDEAALQAARLQRSRALCRALKQIGREAPMSSASG